MEDFLNQLTNTDQFSSGGGNFISDEDLVRKLLRDGDNRFRIMGAGKIYWAHKFKSKNGVHVTAICPKTVAEEGETPECELCARVKKSWDVFNEAEKAQKENRECQYTPQQIVAAKIMVGKTTAPGEKFTNTEAARKMILHNILDRDSEICSQHKHTAVLCKDKYTLGISASKKGIWEPLVNLFKRQRAELADHVAAGGVGVPFDVILIKSGKGLDTSYDKERCASSPITTEELAYEQYDLSTLVKVTPADVVHRWLTVGTKKSEGEQEDSKEERGAPPKPSEQSSKSAPAAQAASPAEPTPPPPAEPTPPPPAEQAAAPAAQTAAPAAQTAADKKAPEVEMDNCPSCKKSIAVTSTKCPHCGEEFEGYEESASTENAATPF